jgi:hypothetical protein
MQRERKKRSKWRAGVWLVFLSCVALLSYLLVQGLFASADPLLKLEAFAGFFVLGCVFLLVARRSGTKNKESSDS